MKKNLRSLEKDFCPQRIFANQLITTEHLLQFKQELFAELKTILRNQQHVVPKKWMKSHEVRRMLKLSPGTLQTLKASGVIPYTKIGGVHLFDYDDIQKILIAGKRNIETI